MVSLHIRGYMCIFQIIYDSVNPESHSTHSFLLFFICPTVEFIAATLEARGAIEDEQVLSAFDKLDVDDTGYISKENICTILGNKCSIKDCDAIVNDLVAEVDANNDGLISYDEFHQLFRQKSRKEPEIGCGCQPKEDAKVPTCS